MLIAAAYAGLTALPPARVRAGSHHKIMNVDAFANIHGKMGFGRLLFVPATLFIQHAFATQWITTTRRELLQTNGNIRRSPLQVMASPTRVPSGKNQQRCRPAPDAAGWREAAFCLSLLIR